MDAAVNLTLEAIKTCNELRKLCMTDGYCRAKSRRAIRSSNIDLYQIFVGPGGCPRSPWRSIALVGILAFLPRATRQIVEV